MLRCSPEAFAQCPTRKYCGSSSADCEFMEGSECDKFNQEIERRRSMYENIAEWIGEGVRPYIAMGISASLALIMGIVAIAFLIMAFWNAWWLLGFALCGVLCGIMIGVTTWIYDECF